jgi:hypothetical protein
MKALLYTIVISALMTSCVKMKGDISMTYQKATAIYGNLDSLRALPLVTEKQPIENPKSFYIGHNFILVGENNKGIHIFDNINMQNPQKMSFIRIPYNKEFYVKGNFLYAESLYDVVKIDISNVYAPVIVGRAINVFWEPLQNDKGQHLIGFEYITATDNFKIGSTEAKEIKKQGKLHVDYLENVIPTSTIPSMFTGSYINSKGTMNRIAVEYGHVYVVSDNKLHVIADQGNFTKVRDLKLVNGTETIYATNQRLFLGSETEMTIYKTDNAAHPVKVSSLSHTESCDPVLPHGNVAYYTLRSVENEGCNEMGENTLNVVNIRNEGDPNVLETFQMKSPYGMCIANDYLFVGEGENGLTVFDASNPRKIVFKKEFTAFTAFDVMVNPFNPNIIIVTNRTGVQQYNIDWNTLHLTLAGQLIYH